MESRDERREERDEREPEEPKRFWWGFADWREVLRAPDAEDEFVLA
jgi:hypothetical protein